MNHLSLASMEKTVKYVVNAAVTNIDVVPLFTAPHVSTTGVKYKALLVRSQFDK